MNVTKEKTTRIYAELTDRDIHAALINYIAGKHPEVSGQAFSSVRINTDTNGSPLSGSVEVFVPKEKAAI